MLSITIPGFGELKLNHLVLDYNGTLAVDGEPISGVKERLNRLSSNLTIHVLTADTFGTVRQKLKDWSCSVDVLCKDHQDEAKCRFVENLGAESTVCIGNGKNDRLMISTAALGIAVIMEEGASMKSVMAADLVFTHITHALDILTNPLRLTASLRS